MHILSCLTALIHAHERPCPGAVDFPVLPHPDEQLEAVLHVLGRGQDVPGEGGPDGLAVGVVQQARAVCGLVAQLVAVRPVGVVQAGPGAGLDGFVHCNYILK